MTVYCENKTEYTVHTLCEATSCSMPTHVVIRQPPFQWNFAQISEVLAVGPIKRMAIEYFKLTVQLFIWGSLLLLLLLKRSFSLVILAPQNVMMSKCQSTGTKGTCDLHPKQSTIGKYRTLICLPAVCHRALSLQGIRMSAADSIWTRLQGNQF